jgi:hypothetical protein
MQSLADLMRIAWGNEDRMANIFGDMGMQTFKINKSISLAELGIFVENSSKESMKKQTMMSMMERFASTGSLDPITMIKTVNADNSAEVEAIITAGLQSVQAASQELEERQVAAQEQENEINAKKIDIPLQVAKINSETDLKIAEMQMQTKLKISGDELDQDAFTKEQERNNELDTMMLGNELSNEEQELEGMEEMTETEQGS